MAKILVSILNYHQIELTIKLIENLQKQDGIENLLICIGDTQPSKEEEKRLKNAINIYNNVKYFKIEDNLGYAKGNNFIINVGKRYINADYYLIVNSDILLQKETDLLKLVEVFNHYNNIAVVGPRVLLSSGRQQGPYLKHTPIIYGIKHLVPFIWAPFFILREYKIKNILSHTEVWRLIGAFLLVKASIFDEIGMFHEKTFLYWEEDILSVKLSMKGYKTLYFPDVTITHYHDQVYKERNPYLEKKFIESMEEYFKVSGYAGFKVKFAKYSVNIYYNFWKPLLSNLKNRREK